MQEVLQWYANNKGLKGIIRVNIVLPQASKTTAVQGQHNFEPGRIRLLKRRIRLLDGTINFTLDEAVVDIDCSCIKMCGLFPGPVADILFALFPQIQREDWQVENVEEDFTHEIDLHDCDVEPV